MSDCYHFRTICGWPQRRLSGHRWRPSRGFGPGRPQQRRPPVDWQSRFCGRHHAHPSSRITLSDQRPRHRRPDLNLEHPRSHWHGHGRWDRLVHRLPVVGRPPPLGCFTPGRLSTRRRLCLYRLCQSRPQAPCCSWQLHLLHWLS